MGNTLIYIHGFNSGPGAKVEDLSKSLPDFKIIAPQLTNNVFESIVTLINLVEGVSVDDNLHIVGTSLGGFYTMYLSTLLSKKSRDIYYYAINPSFEPHLTLVKYVGTSIQNYKTGKSEHITTNFIQDLSTVGVSMKKNYNKYCLHSTYFFLGTEDTILDFNSLVGFLNNKGLPYKIHYSKQDHRFSDLQEVVRAIKQNSIY
jgi:predicted esterase YcpF (UPF0227 family)